MQHAAMRFPVIATAAAALLFQSIQPAIAAEQLAPVGKWNVDFGEDRCIAVRTFGSNSDPVYLTLKPSPIGEVMQMQVVEKGGKRPAVQEKVRLIFGAGEPVPMLQLKYGTDDKQVRMVNLSGEQVNKLSSSARLEWSGTGRQYLFELGPMGKLIETVEKCRAMLADRWNATLTKQMSLKKIPSITGSILSLFSTADYPTAAVYKNQSGLAHVVIMVDEKGGVVDCMLIATSGIAVLDAQTCIILRKRAKFDPAIGTDGRPTRSIFHQRVNWQMP